MTKKCSPVCHYSLFETNFGKQEALHLEYRQRRPPLQMHKTWTHSQDKATPEKIQMALFHLRRMWSWCSHTEQQHHHNNTNHHHHHHGHPHHRPLISPFICSCKLVSIFVTKRSLEKTTSQQAGGFEAQKMSICSWCMPSWCIFFYIFFPSEFCTHRIECYIFLPTISVQEVDTLTERTYSSNLQDTYPFSLKQVPLAKGKWSCNSLSPGWWPSHLALQNLMQLLPSVLASTQILKISALPGECKQKYLRSVSAARSFRFWDDEKSIWTQHDH